LPRAARADRATQPAPIARPAPLARPARPEPCHDHQIDPHAISSVEQLREIYPPPKERSLRKELAYLDGHCRRFVAMSPFVLVSSADTSGACDVSPKGGPPGFVTALDDHRLLIPVEGVA
jgi:hypothetical protein